MSATSRLVPDSECKQGKCGCTTTGCYGKCALEMVPSITMEVCTAPYAELQAELAATKQKLAEANARLHEVAVTCVTAEQKLEALEAERKELEKQEPVGYVTEHDWSCAELFQDMKPGTDLYTRPLPATDLQKRVDELEEMYDGVVEGNNEKNEQIAELTKKLAEQQAASASIKNILNACAEGQLSWDYALRRIESVIDSGAQEELTTILSAARTEGTEEGKKMAVPEGWQVVPKEPTPKMVDATWTEDRLLIESHNTRNKRIYAAMLASAPKPKKEE